MSTRTLDRYGRPYETRGVRQRMGFIAGEVGESGDPVTFTQPAFSMPAVERTADGEDEAPMAVER